MTKLVDHVFDISAKNLRAAPSGITLDDLANEPRWVAWREESPKPGRPPTKVPYQRDGRTRAKNNDPRTWCTRAEAEAALPRLLAGGKAGGVGIILGASALPCGAFLAGLDLDTCRKPSGAVEPWAEAALQLVPSYAEVSPSATGFKIFFRIAPEDMPALLKAIGRTEEGEQRYKRSWARGSGRHPPAIELHLDHSYFTVTGQHHPGMPIGLHVIPKAALLKLIREVGPDFKAGRLKPSAETGKGRSEKAMSIAHRIKANGGSQEHFEEAVDEDSDTSSWKADHNQRQLDRAWSRAGSGETLAEMAGFGLNEDGVAMMFAARHRDRLRFSHHDRCWHEWDGVARWGRDETRRAFNFAREICRDIRLKAAGDPAAKALAKAITASAVERFAQADPALTATAETWDRDPWLLGTPSGTVDLRTGELRTARQDDFITKVTAVGPQQDFDPDLDCPRWLRFLDEATGGDAELIRFLQQWLGYSLTGETREHALLFVYGPGGNGKSVFLNTVIGMLADYALAAPMETFIASSYDRHPTELAMLRGARLVTASETEVGRAWAENRIKQMTGGDRVTARFMRGDFFEYQPQFTLMLSGNHKPVLHNVDEAIRRRFNLVPFENIPKRKDVELESKLKAEWSGILAWAIRGCLDWQANGLIRPAVVQDATAGYFEAQDSFAQWLEEACERGPTYVEKTSDLWISWSHFAADNQVDTRGRAKGFPDALHARGFTSIKNTHGIRGRAYKGLRLRTDDPGFDL
jgi:putative DNA primase/helicase